MKKNFMYLLPILFAATIAISAVKGPGYVSKSEDYPTEDVQLIVMRWTTSVTGEAYAWTTHKYEGELLAYVAEPGLGEASPSVNYDIALENEYGIDLLNGQGYNRTQAATDTIRSTTFVPVHKSKLKLTVSNAGATNAGTAYFYIKR